VPLARTHSKEKDYLASLVQTSKEKRSRDEGGFRPGGGRYSGAS
jgi:hypothetical protein